MWFTSRPLRPPSLSIALLIHASERVMAENAEGNINPSPESDHDAATSSALTVTDQPTTEGPATDAGAEDGPRLRAR